MSYIKIAAAALAVTSFATASLAGNPEMAPVEEMVMEVEEEAGSSAGSSSKGILLPLLGLAVVAALIASDDS